MKIKRGDLVVVAAGDQKSDTPHRVTQVIGGGKKLVVEGINRAFKHVRRGHPKSPQGGRLSVELPIDASNVMFYCESCKTASRLGYRYADDGRKERFCKNCSAAAGTLGPARALYAKK